MPSDAAVKAAREWWGREFPYIWSTLDASAKKRYAASTASLLESFAAQERVRELERALIEAKKSESVPEVVKIIQRMAAAIRRRAEGA